MDGFEIVVEGLAAAAGGAPPDSARAFSFCSLASLFAFIISANPPPLPPPLGAPPPSTAAIFALAAIGDGLLAVLTED